jgi:CTP synthase (UTP-ammonia lyase)
VIGVIGDYDPANSTHRATDAALGHVRQPLPFEWVATDRISHDPAQQLSAYRGLLIAPASPYRSMKGALRAIRFARERGVPLVGT